ncbi:polygalacturonase inhibitor-like [Aristolochia californica]|uniref:polygalacturonase inhibitor-like n=1 Tax=Aristolochia californica TaxID=171875 RepID=UPI0035DD9EC1
MTAITRFSFLVIVLFFLLPSSLGAGCNLDDKRVLLKIKEALNNPYHLASWDPNTDCCDWYALECDEVSSRTISLTIFSGQISGQIPAAVGDLRYLQNLVFRKLSNLSGEIPPAITKLKNLRTLSLSWTNLSGPVPAFLSQLQNLELLDLSFNNLSGTIPPSLAKLTKLLALHLDRNRLTGEIPASFGRFKGSLPELYLSHNRLSGKIPETLGDLDFRVIDLSRNRLVGDALMLFKKTGRSPDWIWIDLSRNLLEFDLSSAKFPVNLTALDMSHNKISGKIPTQITELNDLRSFNASYNRLCGEIPKGGKMQSFDYSSFFHNRCLCGAPLDNKCKQ